MHDDNLLTSLHGETAHRTPCATVVKVGGGEVQLTTFRVHIDGTINLNKMVAKECVYAR